MNAYAQVKKENGNFNYLLMNRWILQLKIQPRHDTRHHTSQ